ncbi:hypothetical protein KW785_00700 [Candidatus Parcubacteria bacterium]|nr:hypothetical protein [Candidatus Parcubacteria bacterium]
MRVAVLRGGPSANYEESLATGEHVLKILRGEPERYELLDIFISRDGQWHKRGVAIKPEDLLLHVDTVFNALHGSYGASGEVQQFLSAHAIPYTGTDAVNSALALQQHLVRERLASEGLRLPRHVVLEGRVTLSDVHKLFRSFMYPMTVMPVRDGTLFGKRVVKSFNDLTEAIAEAFHHSSQVMVEESVRGKEVDCGIIENIRGEKLYALLPHPHLSTEQNKLVENMARQAHSALGLRHYSSSHFVITPRGNIYIVGTTPHPELHENSPFVESLQSVGMTPRECVTHLINLALEK